MKKYQILVGSVASLGILGELSELQLLRVVGGILILLSVVFLIIFPHVLSNIKLGNYAGGVEKRKNFKGSSRQGVVIKINFFSGTVVVANIDRENSQYEILIRGLRIISNASLKKQGLFERVNRARKKHGLTNEVPK